MLFFRFYILLCGVLCFALSANAQTVTLNPLGVNTVGDADEFFTDVWGQPKDFNETCDMGTDASLFKPRGVANGVWSGVHPSIQGPSLQIIQIPVPGTQLAYRENCSKLGLQTPIDANKYTNLSYKLKLTSTSSYSVLWSKENNFSVRGIADFDGYFLPEAGINTPANQWSIKNLDMPAIDDEISWDGEITGLTIWPSYFQPAGGTIQFDWVRITDPDTSPSVALSWTSVGSSGSPQNDSVTLYVDTNNSGYDGVPIRRFLNTSGNINLSTGFLPPGTYYFYVSFDTHNRRQTTVVDNSNYIGPLTINGKPTLQFTAPSRMSGPEYARDELGNPWDMDSTGDLENLFNRDGSEKTAAEKGFNSFNFTDGFFEATTDEDVEGFTVDTQVHFNVPSNKPVDTNFYRYFCYSMQVDTKDLTRDGNSVELNRAGLVARLVYARGSVDNGGGSTLAHELLERSQTYRDAEGGFVTFCIDLWDDTAFETGITWRAAQYASVVRFDPLEASYPTKFSIDSAGLYAENQASSSGTYQIRWEATDPENDSLTITLFYDNDNTGFDGTPIATLAGQSAGSGQYNWDTSSVPIGSYYVYAVISDGLNTNRYYSDVVVNVASVIGITAPPSGAPCDLDGDQKTDFSIVRGPESDANATWFTLRSRDFSLATTEWGTRANDVFFGADFDGDRIADETFVRARARRFVDWFIQPTETLGPYSAGWGLLGDIPVIADIDGDYRDETMIFRPSTGDWWSLRSSLGFLNISWGLNGDIPVPADYDGDNWDDIAVWRPSDGYWWILQSTRGASRAPVDVLYRQWGLPGDHPMPGDYDGDGRADLAVWRPSNGFWYICSSRTNFDCTNFTATQFGLPGDMPIRGDFDGDGVNDLAVWRASDGGWYYMQSSNNQFVFRQWGLPGDLPLCMGMLDTMSLLP